MSINLKTAEEVEVAFEGVDLDKITVSLTINGSAAILIAMYLAMAEKKGFDVAKLRGTAQNDILKEMIGRCRALKLRAVGSEQDLRFQFAILLTMHTMRYIYRSRDWHAV